MSGRLDVVPKIAVAVAVGRPSRNRETAQERYSPRLRDWLYAEWSAFKQLEAEDDARIQQTSSRYDAFWSIEQLIGILTFLKQRFPDKVQLVDLSRRFGVSGLKHPLLAVKLSDQAELDEDEPTIRFDGVHHACEPMGMMVILELIFALLTQYETDPEVKRWVDNLEIWFIPVVNVDGYSWMRETIRDSPWWRKNLRDNNRDGRFEPTTDGVDLNRNYNFNWSSGDAIGASWYFRGEAAGTEPEIALLTRLSREQNFTIGISYHSYGEGVLYPWNGYTDPPDLDLIVSLGTELAGAISREHGYGGYALSSLVGYLGQSSNWNYGELRTLDYTVEVGTDHIPHETMRSLGDAFIPGQTEQKTETRIHRMAEQQINGAKVLFRRMGGSQISGHLLDSQTGQGINGTLDVTRLDGTASHQLEGDHVRPRRTDPKTGRFERLLHPGKYRLSFTAKGYQEAIITVDIPTSGNDHQPLRVPLKRRQADQTLTY